MSPFISGELDFSSLRKNGYVTAEVSQYMTSMLMDCLRKETFVPDYESKHGDGFDPSETGYINMYVAADRMGDRPGGFYEVWLNHVMAWAAPYVGMYMNQPTGLDAQLAITQCRDRYYMDWHHDVGERGVAIALLYLNEEKIEPEHGGELLISRVTRDGNGDPVSREITGEFAPTTGTMVLMDASSALFEHKVNEYKNPNSHRYCLAAVLGIPRGNHV